ncbi:hypothetical protein KI387_044155 [Taxus chinensis]|uniref:ACT domain-containing protein n=1 Tax=Taxus chinensis TaxID=29808 RepID=A0AA38F6Y0_TAXCH|nr:hypothetical protein KI387_044155 [Taxus chinensis]
MAHAFCVGDRSHPQAQEIYAMLEKTSWEMKSLGTNACLLPSFRKTVGVKAAPEHTTIELTGTERRLHQMMFADHDYERVHSILLESRDDTTRPIATVQNCVEKGYSVINIKSKDRPKLLFDTIFPLTDMQYVVFHGAVDLDGPDAFQEYYIRHMDGCPVNLEAERERIIHCLEAAIERRISEGMRLELCSCDRVGLLSDVTRIFRENGLSVTRVEVSTRGDKAAALKQSSDWSTLIEDAKSRDCFMDMESVPRDCFWL